jgi:hypothetical protein
LRKRKHSTIENDTCPRDADLRNGSHREGEREYTCKTTSR